MISIKCSQCNAEFGTKIKHGSPRFCPSCGTELKFSCPIVIVPQDTKDRARLSLERGDIHPYDASDEWRQTRDEGPPPAPKSWEHRAARGIVSNLCDRKGISSGFEGIDEETRVEIIETLALIIHEANPGRPHG